MPNITRGGRMRGVVAYLVGPGKQNEHRSPHLVAGDPGLMSGWGQTALDRRGVAVEIADYLDHPRRTFGTKVTIPVKGSDGHHHGDRRDAHVWHCSLSLQAAEGEISDEQWSAIAEEFASGMGFAGSDTAPQCRWAAIRHGVSSGGNDHVHLVVSMVREDGSTARVNRDRPRAQKLAGELERKHGLAVLESITGHAQDCLNNLARAIELNPKCRLQARVDNDFQNMADDPRFTELLYPEIP